jgi:hypothetical protein
MSKRTASARNDEEDILVWWIRFLEMVGVDMKEESET